MPMVKPASRRRYDGAGVRTKSRRKPREEWLALKPGAHEGYVDWERAEAIRRMVSEQHPDEPASWRAQAWRCACSPASSAAAAADAS